MYLLIEHVFVGRAELLLVFKSGVEVVKRGASAKSRTLLPSYACPSRKMRVHIQKWASVLLTTSTPCRLTAMRFRLVPKACLQSFLFFGACCRVLLIALEQIIYLFLSLFRFRSHRIVSGCTVLRCGTHPRGIVQAQIISTRVCMQEEIYKRVMLDGSFFSKFLKPANLNPILPPSELTHVSFSSANRAMLTPMVTAGTTTTKR